MILFLDGRKSGIMGFHKTPFRFPKPLMMFGLQAWWKMPTIPAVLKADAGQPQVQGLPGPQAELKAGGNLVRPCFKLKNKKKKRTKKIKTGLKIEFSGGGLG